MGPPRFGRTSPCHEPRFPIRSKLNLWLASPAGSTRRRSKRTRTSLDASSLIWPEPNTMDVSCHKQRSKGTRMGDHRLTPVFMSGVSAWGVLATLLTITAGCQTQPAAPEPIPRENSIIHLNGVFASGLSEHHSVYREERTGNSTYIAEFSGATTAGVIVATLSNPGYVVQYRPVDQTIQTLLQKPLNWEEFGDNPNSAWSHRVSLLSNSRRQTTLRWLQHHVRTRVWRCARATAQSCLWLFLSPGTREAGR